MIDFHDPGYFPADIATIGKQIIKDWPYPIRRIYALIKRQKQ